VTLPQAETPLLDAVRAYLRDPEITPFTTPGHKRSPELADALLAGDLPLSGGADDLHLSGGVLARAERLAADLWDADYCRFCLNGSTQGNQALALAVAREGGKVIVGRNLHKSLFMGLVLAGLEPVWVRPDVDGGTGLALAVQPGRVEEALRAHPDARAVFLVEPSFVGVLSDVAAIAALCHEAGAPLIVDQAWGAHLGFHPDLPPHTLALGADAMVTSAHKTLAAFTQGAYLFARGSRIDLRRLDEAYDPTKLVLALAGTGADGSAVEQDLWKEGVRLELANRDTLIPLVTIGDTEASIDRLVSALERSLARRSGAPRAVGGSSAVWSVEPATALSPREAFFAERETVPAQEAPGRVAAEMIAPYPPGIPAIAPGEVISADLLAALSEAAADGTRIAYCADPSLATVQVVAR
jgi:lysine decarboxylase